MPGIGPLGLTAWHVVYEGHLSCGVGQLVEQRCSLDWGFVMWLAGLAAGLSQAQSDLAILVRERQYGRTVRERHDRAIGKVL